MAAKSSKDLQSEFQNVEWRQKFLDFFDLMEILGDCYISDNYVIPDSLNNAIQLSNSGKAVMGKLTRKEKVTPKEARLMCALSIGHEDLFVDLDLLDIGQLQESIHTQILDSSIRFPLVHGRGLYDAFAEIHEDEKVSLSAIETQKLLENLPIGVFQYGRFVIGPFGIRRSLGSRSIESSRSVPAFHCERTTCHRVHSIILQTGDAPINKEREKLRKILQESGKSSEWAEFASDLRGFKNSFFAESGAGVLLPLLGDALSDPELKMVVGELFDSTNGTIRDQVSGFLEVRNSADTVKNLNRAQLLQIVLLANESTLSRTVDRLVVSGDIRIPVGDVRRAVIGKNRASGAFQLSAELGHYGVRFISNDRGHALLRLKRLIEKLYNLEKSEEQQELEWQLRKLESSNLNERLETYFRENSPENVVRKLVLARKSNIVLACQELSIEEYDQLNDDQIVSALLWKLGFRVGEEADPHDNFWERHQHLSALSQSSTIGDSTAFSEIASPHFRDLEGILLNSLAFTSWALTTDHSREPQPFTYDNENDRRSGLQKINEAKKILHPNDRKPVDFTGEKVDLHDLISGFSLFSQYLKTLKSNPDSFKRSRDDFPEFQGKTELKLFKFDSTVPFLNLASTSQEMILSGLDQINKVLSENEVTLVRNDYAHYRRNLPDIQRFEMAMDAIRVAVSKLENLGFCEMLFKPTSVTSDEWGHQKLLFTGPRSHEHTFTRPTQYDWMGLPDLSQSQYLFRSAFFDGPNEVLRFTRRYQSEFSKLWENFPKRRTKGKTPLGDEDGPEHKSESNVTGE